MNTINLTLATLFLATPALAYDQQDCADYVKEKKYPAAYCQLTDDKSPELEVWLEQLRAVPGPIQALEKKILAESGCEPESSCGIGGVVATDRIVLEQGNDSMGGGSRIRYFLSYSEGKMDSVVYTIDVEQAVDMQTETSIRKIGKVQKFED
jgi:hypothetical protein